MTANKPNATRLPLTLQTKNQISILAHNLDRKPQKCSGRVTACKKSFTRSLKFKFDSCETLMRPTWSNVRSVCWRISKWCHETKTISTHTAADCEKSDSLDGCKWLKLLGVIGTSCLEMWALISRCHYWEWEAAGQTKLRNGFKGDKINDYSKALKHSFNRTEHVCTFLQLSETTPNKKMVCTQIPTHENSNMEAQLKRQ